MHRISVGALAIGALIVVQGVAGLAVPELFASVVTAMQVPPVLYVAALIRVAFGVVLILAASRSRWPLALRTLGVLVALGGLVTPFYGVDIARVILDSWAQGGVALVRIWGAGALALGAFIVYATYKRGVEDS